MATRQGTRVDLTIACAMIGRYLRHLDDYLAQKASIKSLAEGLAAEYGFDCTGVVVNGADDPSSNSIYLTVTGTSAESGDDGQVGRGNRVNGLITPGRPMSLEAAAGKNPITHVGKLYNVLARRIADEVVSELPQVTAAQCLLVSRIGAPVSEPAATYVKLKTKDEFPAAQLAPNVEQITSGQLARTSLLIDQFVEGALDVF